MKLLFIFIFFSFMPTFATGEQLWYSGFNGNITATGYGGIAVKDSYNFLNPAANAENIRIFSSGNISSTNWGGSFGVSTPTDLGGIFFTGTQYLSYDNTSLVNIGYGKNVQSDLSFGLEGLLSIHPYTQNIIGGGFRMGFLWSPDLHMNNWGFGDFSLGAVWKMLVHPTGSTCCNPTPEMLWQLGIEATVMKYTNAHWKFIFDYSVGFIPFNNDDIRFQTWASIGTTFTFWDIWDISAGTILGNNGLGFGNSPVLPYTVGTALGYEWDSFSFKLSYSFGGQEFFSDKPEYMHTAALELGIGQKTSTNRAAILTTKNHQDLTNYFSPNNDLMQDTMVFQSHIVGKNINSWELVIINSRGSIVRTFQADETKTDSKVGAFVYNYFMPTRSLYMPNQIVWDGKDNQGEYVPEGVYQAMLSVKYDENKQISSEVNTIIVDTTKPSGVISIQDPYVFLGDDPESVLKIGQTLSSHDPWSAKLVDNTDNKVVAQWFWKKGEVPTFIEWKLDNPKRINVGYGKFSYIATSYDQAGNYAEEKFTNITIETRKRDPKISIDKTVFSPANGDIVTITPKYGVTTGLTKSTLIVYDQGGRKIYTQDVTDLNETIEWSGTDNNKKIVNDGTYIIILEQFYVDKEQFDSQALLVEVDTTPPLFSVDFSPKRFSPDGDNIDDVLKMDFSAQDTHNVAKWTISILNENDEVLCRFQGKDPSKTLFWYPNKIVSSRDLLYFNIEICDDVGNKLDTIFYELRVDVLLDKDGAIITKNNAFFEEGLGNLNREMYPYLDEIWEYYRYNPQDKIRILTKASFQEASMNRSETEKLALTRVNSAKAYLMSRGINENNIEVEVHVFNEKNEKRQQALRQLQIFLTK